MGCTPCRVKAASAAHGYCAVLLFGAAWFACFPDRAAAEDQDPIATEGQEPSPAAPEPQGPSPAAPPTPEVDRAPPAAPPTPKVDPAPPAAPSTPKVDPAPPAVPPKPEERNTAPGHGLAPGKWSPALTPEKKRTPSTRSSPQEKPKTDHEHENDPEWFVLDMGAGTHFPVSWGFEVTAKIHPGLLIQGHLGWFPGAYVSAFNEAATGFGWYNDATATVIEDSVGNSLVLRLSGGWALPWGFEVTAGYTNFNFGGNVSALQAIEAAAGVDFTGVAPDVSIPADANLHALHAAISWKVVFLDFLFARVGLGFTRVISSKVDIEVPESEVPDEFRASVENAEREAVNYLEDILNTYGYVPEIRLTFGLEL